RAGDTVTIDLSSPNAGLDQAKLNFEGYCENWLNNLTVNITKNQANVGTETFNSLKMIINAGLEAYKKRLTEKGAKAIDIQLNIAPAWGLSQINADAIRNQYLNGIQLQFNTIKAQISS